MTQVTVRQAADMAGVTRQSMYRLIDAGKVSAQVAHDGTKVIDTSELMRHFGPLQSPDAVPKKKSDGQRQTPGDSATQGSFALQIEVERLRGQLAAKEVEIAMLRQRAEDLKADKESFVAFAERQQQLLAAPKKKPNG